jgi:hypothetical protein
VEVAIDFLSSELQTVLFPTAADDAQGQREVVRGYEEFLTDAKSKGITNIPDPYRFAVLLVGAANFAVAYNRDEKTFDRDALSRPSSNFNDTPSSCDLRRGHRAVSLRPTGSR